LAGGHVADTLHRQFPMRSIRTFLKRTFFAVLGL
jgi:hypothetical protein